MNIDKFELVCWDFDGVIKESVSVKTDAFVELFQPYGNDVCNKVKQHHIENGGMSRFEKIPMYLRWAGVKLTDSIVKEFCTKFSDLVKDRVIESPWVPGVESYLRKNKNNLKFIMVSATPQTELDSICSHLQLSDIFFKIYGSPINKANAIRESMHDCRVTSSECLMIGDAQADIDAAKENKITFILRRHDLNKNLIVDSDAQVISDFLGWR
jgi:phosphoglycolate phosphatase-like HAD superfamily hydrolase